MPQPAEKPTLDNEHRSLDFRLSFGRLGLAGRIAVS
jgi:hypothetical protein